MSSTRVEVTLNRWAGSWGPRRRLRYRKSGLKVPTWATRINCSQSLGLVDGRR